ncbi:Phytanoyl-CoA dioxygenase (PhyH) [Actinopolymorpha singaporensis]|uniref:Phytanoyl-CoA dioxygenase (PhyH) n=2 Tax=Actinopolymorpha singaporensis TaxID=117157 RepID=A0A1H1QYS5_9ACTN|nr:Phytanoyl-CoA dioxygenase (PhyH) [Actinopolymorpha singaporensis]
MTASTREPSCDQRDSAEWRDQIMKYGYVIVHDAVPADDLQAVIDDMWRHTGASPDDPDSWYRPDVIRPVGMVEMYHYQSMWNIRQSPRVYEIFKAIHGTDRLSVSIDRVGLKPPVDPRYPEYDHKGMIHWDTDMTQYPDIPFRVQGVLALTDTEPDMGGFQCVPEIYQDLEAYLKTQTPERIASRNPDYSAYTVTRPRLAAGDLLIWTTRLLHGNGHNTSQRPRFAQYLSMNPVGTDEAARQQRIQCWQANTHPSGAAFPGDPRGIEEKRSAPAELTPLGRKLLGVDLWD